MTQTIRKIDHAHLPAVNEAFDAQEPRLVYLPYMSNGKAAILACLARRHYDSRQKESMTIKVGPDYNGNMTEIKPSEFLGMYHLTVADAATLICHYNPKMKDEKVVVIDFTSRYMQREMRTVLGIGRDVQTIPCLKPAAKVK